MQRKFTALNGLRIFAALSVVCFHYGTLAASFKVLPRFAQNLIENGTIALPFFYVLVRFCAHTRLFQSWACTDTKARLL